MFRDPRPTEHTEAKFTSSCNHEPDVCRPCLTTSISTQFNGNVWDQIDCPNCGQRLEFHDVKAFADSVVFGRSELIWTLDQKETNKSKQVRRSLATSMPFWWSIPTLSPPKLPIRPAVLSRGRQLHDLRIMQRAHMYYVRYYLASFGNLCRYCSKTCGDPARGGGRCHAISHNQC